MLGIVFLISLDALDHVEGKEIRLNSYSVDVPDTRVLNAQYFTYSL